MNKAELAQRYPALYKEVFNEGVQAGMSAHRSGGEVSGQSVEDAMVAAAADWTERNS